MKKNKQILFILGILLIFLGVGFFLLKKNKENVKEATLEKINTMLMLIEFEKIDGVLQWEKELDQRNLTALVKVQKNVLEDYPEVFKRLADKGYEIAGGYDEAPFWDMPYDEQYQYLKEAKTLVEQITGKTMRVFGSRYFSYDENTLKAADALGIEYILGRGVKDVEAVIYQPKEYKVKVISVTNVDVGEPMGRGSLCDYSLWARGANASEFGKILDESIAKKPNNMIIVSHAYLGGTRLEWWQQYQRVLVSEKLNWCGFSEWLKNQKIITLSNTEIPVNREVRYTTPSPEKPMEDYEPIPGIEDACKKEASEAAELMCS